ncbi:hypothetical protein [Maribacter sp. 2307UL18-2]|uniref:hypothetical protein n=1 Tax=Maribacter sp. 2307UL18-2 TaxID=3386274 RepID=UPI0039BCE043
MNNDFYIWLRTSLFYDMNDWESLLMNGIRPFLISAKETKYLNKFTIYLNQKRGDNIRISFEVLFDKKEKFLSYFDHYFKDYLINNPSLSNVKHETSTEPLNLFKNFPNDSIQYNVYDPSLVNFSQNYPKEFESFGYFFSRILLEKKYNRFSSYESIFEFSISLHILMIRSFTINIRKANSLFEEILVKTDFNNLYLGIVPVLDSRFEKNKRTYLALFKNIWRSDYTALPYSKDWVDICKQLTIKSSSFKDYSFTISRVLSEHLNLNNLEWFAPLYLCYKMTLNSK